MRDHTKLRAFELADQLAVVVYKLTAEFPKHELFGLTNQMRRAAVSAASNIVEGCARRTEADYLRFLDMAYSSTKELGYQISLSQRSGYLSDSQFKTLDQLYEESSRVLNGLINSLRRNAAEVR